MGTAGVSACNLAILEPPQMVGLYIGLNFHISYRNNRRGGVRDLTGEYFYGFVEYRIVSGGQFGGGSVRLAAGRRFHPLLYAPAKGVGSG